jgi:hypothetical protein
VHADWNRWNGLILMMNEARHRLIENKGARRSGITHSVRIEKGIKKNFAQERLCLLTPAC